MIVTLVVVLLMLTNPNPGMVWSKGGIHGRMEFGVLIVLFHLAAISLMSCRSRIKLAASSTSPPLPSTKLQEASVPSTLPAVLSFLFLFLLLQENTLY